MKNKLSKQVFEPYSADGSDWIEATGALDPYFSQEEVEDKLASQNKIGPTLDQYNYTVLALAILGRRLKQAIKKLPNMPSLKSEKQKQAKQHLQYRVSSDNENIKLINELKTDIIPYLQTQHDKIKAKLDNISKVIIEKSNTVEMDNESINYGFYKLPETDGEDKTLFFGIEEDTPYPIEDSNFFPPIFNQTDSLDSELE